MANGQNTGTHVSKLVFLMKLMNYNKNMKPQRTLSPPRPVRPLRQSLRRNTTRADVPPEAENAEYGYVVVGARKLPVRKPDTRRDTADVDADAAGAIRPRGNMALTAPNHEVIEDLFREARDGKFDSFSRRLKGIIEQYATADEAVQLVRNPVSADPLAAARQRGIDYALTEWQKPENLTLQAAASYAGVSDNTINTRRQTCQIYALVAPNRSRGFRYPHWQFDVDATRLAAAIKAFSDAGQENSWVLHNLLMRPTPELDDIRPCDYIADSSLDIKRLVQFIQRRFMGGDQGAA